MKWHEICQFAPPRRRRKRVGRGIAAGGGKTAGRGTKGAKARGPVKPRYEGGQTPLHRRLPKLRGQSRSSRPWGPFRKEYAVINLEALNRFEEGTVVTPQLLKEQGLVKNLKDGLKVLGDGEVTRRLVVKAHAFSRSALEKLQAAGCQVEVLS